MVLVSFYISNGTCLGADVSRESLTPPS